MSGAARTPYRKVVTGVEAATGKNIRQLRSEASTAEGCPPGEDAAGWNVPQSEGERAGVWNPGSGKTHLLSALAQDLIRGGRKVAFTTCTRLVQELLLAKKELRLSRAIRKLAYFEALVIDDLGYVQQSRDEMEVLFTLLAERYERGSVLISSNIAFSKWEAIFKDPMTTAAAIDRLVHHSVILELNIPSYRMEQAKKKKAEAE